MFAKATPSYQALPNMGAITVGLAAQDGQKPSIVAITLGKSTLIKTIGAISLETDATGPVVRDNLESCKSYLFHSMQG